MKTFLLFITVVVVFTVAFFGAFIHKQPEVSLFKDESFQSLETPTNPSPHIEEMKKVPTLSITLTNEYNDSFELYPFDNIVQIYKPTTFIAKADPLPDSASFAWIFAGTRYEGTEVTLTFNSLGQQTVELILSYKDRTQSTNFSISSRYVRREIRTLTTEDREAFFSALETIYHYPTLQGKELFGDDYLGIDYFVSEHLLGAATKACDHWHDDAGIMTHHLSFTLAFEKALQVIDPTVSIPYWEYTYDDYVYGEHWQKSPIFDSDWFGFVSSKFHIITTGRFAYLSVLSNASSVSSIYNPYNLLRSPWNANPMPFVSRSTLVLDQRPYKHFPSCAAFSSGFEESWIGTLNNYLNGLLHGPVHIMIGGHWNPIFSSDLINDLMGRSISDILLMSKNLWRQGYLTCPSSCSSSVSLEDCHCDCSIRFSENFDAYNFLSDTDQLKYFTLSIANVSYKDGRAYLNDLSEDEQSIFWEDAVQALCSIGVGGEMFTSAAPYDPIFWILHTAAERFMQYRRFSSYYGSNPLNETWGYEHSALAPSDTQQICDWFDLTDGLPTCYTGTCSGHHKNDNLPERDLLKTKKVLTNIEYYDFLDPRNSELTYVYDNFQWSHCTDQGISFNF